MRASSLLVSFGVLSVLWSPCESQLPITAMSGAFNLPISSIIIGASVSAMKLSIAGRLLGIISDWFVNRGPEGVSVTKELVSVPDDATDDELETPTGDVVGNRRPIDDIGLSYGARRSGRQRERDALWQRALDAADHQTARTRPYARQSGQYQTHATPGNAIGRMQEAALQQRDGLFGAGQTRRRLPPGPQAPVYGRSNRVDRRGEANAITPASVHRQQLFLHDLHRMQEHHERMLRQLGQQQLYFQRQLQQARHLYDRSMHRTGPRLGDDDDDDDGGDDDDDDDAGTGGSARDGPSREERSGLAASQDSVNGSEGHFRLVEGSEGSPLSPQTSPDGSGDSEHRQETTANATDAVSLPETSSTANSSDGCCSDASPDPNCSCGPPGDSVRDNPKAIGREERGLPDEPSLTTTSTVSGSVDDSTPKSGRRHLRLRKRNSGDGTLNDYPRGDEHPMSEVWPPHASTEATLSLNSAGRTRPTGDLPAPTRSGAPSGSAVADNGASGSAETEFSTGIPTPDESYASVTPTQNNFAEVTQTAGTASVSAPRRVGTANASREITEDEKNLLAEYFSEIRTLDRKRCVLKMVCYMGADENHFGSYGRAVAKFFSTVWERYRPNFVGRLFGYDEAFHLGRTHGHEGCTLRFNSCPMSIVNVALLAANLQRSQESGTAAHVAAPEGDR